MTLQRPKVIFFDVNETLLDLAPLKASIRKTLGGRDELGPLWFASLLHYSLVATVGDRYRDFDEIGAAVLQMVAGGLGIGLSGEAARRMGVAGALWAGMRAVFLRRPGQQVYPLAEAPECCITELSQLADWLTGSEDGR